MCWKTLFAHFFLNRNFRRRDLAGKFPAIVDLLPPIRVWFINTDNFLIDNADSIFNLRKSPLGDNPVAPDGFVKRIIVHAFVVCLGQRQQNDFMSAHDFSNAAFNCGTISNKSPTSP